MAADTPNRFKCPDHWTLAQRLAHYTDRSGGDDACWTWRGHTNSCGYGTLKLKRKNWLAHRVAWIVANGPIPSDKPHVLHRCDNPPCVNPAHLWTDTHVANMADRDAKKRGVIVYGERCGTAKLTEADVRAIRVAIKTERQCDIARRLGVHNGTVSRAMRGESWKHVA